jgi:hypothetical protein
MQWTISSSRPSSAFRGHSGSVRNARPNPATSIRPAAIASSASRGSVKRLTATIGIETPLLIRSTSGRRNPVSMSIDGLITWKEAYWPALRLR